MRNVFRILPALALPALALLLPAVARADGVAVEHAWSRPALAGRVGVVYFTLTDTGAPDQLTGASSPVAKQAELHETIDTNGIMKMRPVQELTVAPDKPLLFAPGGYHVMLMGLTQTLKLGQTFPLTLTFAHAGPVTVDVHVESGPHGSSATGPGMGAMPGMVNMPGMAH